MEIRVHIQWRSDALVRAHERGGLGELRAEIAHQRRADPSLMYHLRPAQNDVSQDELPRAPPQARWIKYRHDGHRHIALVRALPDGWVLSVSEDASGSAPFAGSEALARALALVAGIGAVGAIGVAVFVAIAVRSTSSFVSQVFQTLASVTEGDFSVRLEEGSNPAATTQLSARVNAALEELERRDAEMKSTLNTIAHETRTPLGHLVQHLAIMKDETATEADRQGALVQLEERLDAVLRSHDAILRLAHLESDAPQPTSIFDLGLHAANTANAFDAAFAESGRELAVRCEPAKVAADPDLVAIATATLLENILAHTPSGVRAEVATWTTPEESVLRISDNGPGICAEERPHVIERFKRGAHSKGLGLGLAIVDAIARRTGATLRLSDANPGLCVDLVFKRPPAASRTETTARTRPPVKLGQ